MSKKMMISQPMNGRTNEQILEERNAIVGSLSKEGFEIINTFFDGFNVSGDAKNIPLIFLAKSLDKMADCDVVYFAKGWEKARGCRIEHEAAVAYNLEIIYA